MRQPENLIFQYLDTVGDGTGTKEMAANYSGAAAVFKITAPDGYALDIDNLQVSIADNAALSAAGYGGAAALTNGITLKIHDAAGDAVVDLTPITIKTNYHWTSAAFHTQPVDWGNGDNAVTWCWGFSACGGSLPLPEGYSLRATVHDNLSTLVSHTMRVKGSRRRTSV